MNLFLTAFLHAFNRTIFGIETVNDIANLFNGETFNRTIFGIETRVL